MSKLRMAQALMDIYDGNIKTKKMPKDEAFFRACWQLDISIDDGHELMRLFTDGE